jgi:hypothetical protein
MTHGHPASPIWLHNCKRMLAPILVIVLLASVAWREYRSHPLDFWSHSDGYGDYVNITLAHAFNIDFGLSESSSATGRRINENNTLHPGFPLQAASWMAYRISSISEGLDAAARCVAVLTDPAAFWLSIRLIAIAIGLAFSALYARAASSNGFLYSMAVGLVYFCYEPAWDYSIRLLGNETFALPLALGVAWVAGRCLNRAEQNSDLKWWVAWGSLCALCWLNKLNYIAWTVAAVPACAAHVYYRRPAFREIGLRLALFGGGFVAAAYALAALMLGSGGLGRILQLHFGVLTHSGSYGNGPAGAVSLSKVVEALHSLTTYWSFLCLAGLICLLAVWILVSAGRKGMSSCRDSAYLIYLLSAAALFLAATLKHYGAHYLIAGVPAISLLMLGIATHIGPKPRLALAIAVGLVLIHSYRRFSTIQDANFRRVTEMKESLRAMEALPGRPGDSVLWTYRLPDRRFVMELIQFLAGVPEVGAIIDETLPSPDRSYFLWSPNVREGTESVTFEKVKWRYAVFEKGNYEQFLTGSQAGAKAYFEQNCKMVIDGPVISVLERTHK